MKTMNRAMQRVLLFCTVGLLCLTTPASTLFAQGRTSILDDGARYRVEFMATWSQDTHPHPADNFPSTSAHFSPLTGAVHNADVAFWAPGALASAGIEQMAETGATSLLRAEIEAAQDEGEALSLVEGTGALSPGGATIHEVEVSADFPLITLVTMIAPSPDWFVGISGESMLDEDGLWVEEKMVVLYPYDAGTDSGSDYRSPNADTAPAEEIRSVRSQTPFSDAPIGTFTFTRIDEPSFFVYMPAAW